VQLGQGDGTFVKSPMSYGAGDFGTAGIDALDIDLDGAVDLVTATRKSDMAFVTLIRGRFRTPNAVEMAGFSAQSVEEGVLVSWATAYEGGHAGFRLYRSTTPTNGREPIGPALVRPTDPYRYVDTNVSAGAEYFYWLEALDLQGGTQWFGPAAARWLAVPQTNRLYRQRPTRSARTSGRSESRSTFRAHR